MSWFNKETVTVDTNREFSRGNDFTLIANKSGNIKTFSNSRELVQYLYDDKFYAKEWIDEKVRYEVDKELEMRKNEKFNKHFTFFINKDVAPLILNKMDAMECVEYWKIDKTELFNDVLEVKYDASRQVLFQTSNGVVLKED